VSTALLGAAGGNTGDGIVIIGDMVYLEDGDPERTAGLVAALRRCEAVGPIFTGARGTPVVPGTCPLAAVGLDGVFAPDIMFSPRWDRRENAFGYAGGAWSLYPLSTKAASHGSISPWDVRNTLIAAGPSFKRGLVSDVPAGNQDIAPTLLHTLGLTVPAGLDGRVLHEALLGGPAPADVAVGREDLRVEAGSIRQTVQRARVRGTRYVDGGTIEM
jgi:hypothetical protein